VVGGGILLIGSYYAYENAGSRKKQKVKFITGDESDRRIEATVSFNESTNIGVELSSILREQR
jgi:hypothetical protein